MTTKKSQSGPGDPRTCLRARHVPGAVALMTALAALLVSAAPQPGHASRQAGGGVTPLGDFVPPPVYGIVLLDSGKDANTAGLNDAGTVVGSEVFPNSDRGHAALW